MNRTILIPLLLVLANCLWAQEVVFTGTGDANITIERGDLVSGGPIEAPGDGEFVLDMTITSEFGFPSTAPGLLIVNFAALPPEERLIGSFRSIRTVDIEIELPFIEEADYSAALGNASPEQAALVAGQPASLGDLFVQLENETGERALFPMGPLSAWGGARGMTSRNPFHPGDMRATEALGQLPEQTWYLSALIITAVRPALTPPEIYILAVGVTGE